MIKRHRLIAVEGDGKRITRTAHRHPAEVRVYAGGPETRPSAEMGGPSMCPSVLLLVQPDGGSVNVRYCKARAPAVNDYLNVYNPCISDPFNLDYIRLCISLHDNHRNGSNAPLIYNFIQN